MIQGCSLIVLGKIGNLNMKRHLLLVDIHDENSNNSQDSNLSGISTKEFCISDYNEDFTDLTFKEFVILHQKGKGLIQKTLLNYFK